MRRRRRNKRHERVLKRLARTGLHTRIRQLAKRAPEQRKALPQNDTRNEDASDRVERYGGEGGGGEDSDERDEGGVCVCAVVDCVGEEDAGGFECGDALRGAVEPFFDDDACEGEPCCVWVEREVLVGPHTDPHAAVGVRVRMGERDGGDDALRDFCHVCDERLGRAWRERRSCFDEVVREECERVCANTECACDENERDGCCTERFELPEAVGIFERWCAL